MKRAGGRFVIASIMVTGLALAGHSRAELKTLKRVDDPIVLECKEFGPLFGSPLDSLALMARNHDAWAPIPFQIDQKKPDGTYAFTMGPEACMDPDPNLDANDELVFMVKDSGDRADDGKWPEKAVAAMELALTDPKDGSRGWVYLVRFPGKAPCSGEDYIRVEVDEANQYRRVVTYEFIMGGPMDRIYPDYMAGSRLANGRPGLDVLDRLKMRGEVELPLGISIPFSLDDLSKAEDKGWIDGPVRVLHLADGYLEVTSYIKIRGSGYSLISYYVNHMIWPLTIDVPMSNGLAQIVNFRGYMDFNSNVYGSYPFSAANPLNQEVVFDGRMSEAEKNLNTETHIDWIAGYGPQGALVSRLFFSPEPPNLIQTPYYLDDETASDPPEDHPGLSVAGYRLENVESEDPKVPITTYQYYYYMNELKPEDVHRILDILDHPVKIMVSAVEPMGEAPAPGQ